MVNEEEKKPMVLFGDVVGMQKAEGGVAVQMFVPWPPSPAKPKDDASEEDKQKYQAAVLNMAAYLKAMEGLHLGVIQMAQD